MGTSSSPLPGVRRPGCRPVAPALRPPRAGGDDGGTTVWRRRRTQQLQERDGRQWAIRDTPGARSVVSSTMYVIERAS